MRFANILLLIFVFFQTACTLEKNSPKDQSPILQENEKPNIVIIYMDDLGYGDLSCYGATEIQTPHIDALAKNGIRFTQGYATSSTCTPSRYALLTGQYPWKKKAKVLNGDAPILIDSTQMTLPKALQSNGYATGIVGKWHLGLGDGNINWNKKIHLNTQSVGFDYEYIMAATNDRVPTVYVENGHVVGLHPDDPIEIDYRNNFGNQPTGKTHPEFLKFNWSHGHNSSITNGISRIGFMKGGNAALWIDEQMAEEFHSKAVDFVEKNKDRPFFLYYAFHQPHVPRVPSPRFEGKSKLGPRGDVILEADWYVGEFMKFLKENDLMKNTIVILTSDNGPVLDDGYEDQSAEKNGAHDANGGLRGGKYSLFEAGTRVPFIAYWDGKIQPEISNELMTQLDLSASLASLGGVEWEGASESKNNINALLGNGKTSRDFIIQTSNVQGRCLRTTDGWSYLPPHEGKTWGDQIGIESGFQIEEQLYNLNEDIGQQNNLAIAQPEKLEELKKLFENEVYGN